MIRVDYDENHGVTIYRYENTGDVGKRTYWTHDGKYKEVKANETNVPYWLVLDHNDAEALIASLADYYLDDPSPKEDVGYMKGLLEAQTLHLSDMRKLAILEPMKGDPQA